ncbi:MAG: light-harvesting antenna LH1, beta subunit [Alphaproteobacteria bacterium]
MMEPDRSGPFSVMSEEEAKEIHSYFVLGFLGFTAIALVAHLFVWAWRPWGWLPYA